MAVTKATPIYAYPRWVARVAPAPFPRFGMLDVYADIFAPIRNNFGTDATVYLGNWRVGLVEQGRRLVYADGRVSAVDPDRTSLAIESVLPRGVGLGGGFLFSGPAGLYFADTFDGPMRKLASDAQLFLGVAPGSVLLGGEQGGFVSTSNALPHGLRLAGGQLWETKDAWHTWHPVAPPPTGRVPRDLAAAMCFESGCVLGPWARIGWN